MTARTVVVTGIGAISPLGLDFPSTMAGLLDGRSGISLAPAALTGGAGHLLAAPVDLPAPAGGAKPDMRCDRTTHLGLIAAREAMRDAGLPHPSMNGGRSGVFTGIAMGGTDTFDRTLAEVAAAQAGRPPGAPRPAMHPFSVIRLMPNALCGWLSIEFGLRGPTHTYAAACASSALALGEAMRCIRHGYADTILVVGAEATLFPVSFAAWDAMRVMAWPDPLSAASSLKPFDRRRNGFVLGEGAAALVLEDADTARRRGGRPRAKLAGYGCASDASHITRPLREGQVEAMCQALADAQVDAGGIGYINAHGTATKVGDVVEVQAVKEVFGVHAGRLAISSTKSMHGHLLGAGGALEFATALHALGTGSIAPTAHLTEPDPECDLDFVPCVARHRQVLEGVMSNSFAFGGTNVSLVATRVDA